jgi:hypothetical protein
LGLNVPLPLRGRADKLIEQAAHFCSMGLLGPPTMSAFAPLLADKRTSNAPRRAS